MTKEMQNLLDEFENILTSDDAYLVQLVEDENPVDAIKIIFNELFDEYTVVDEFTNDEKCEMLNKFADSTFVQEAVNSILQESRYAKLKNNRILKAIRRG